MTEMRERSAAPRTDALDSAGRAWYLYGLVRAPGAAPGLSEDHTSPDLQAFSAAGVSLGLLQFGDLAAVVRAVPRSEFTDEAMEARLRDPDALEELVRAHNDVITAIHQQEAILPAKLGGIYARLDDLKEALGREQDTLRAQLDHITGCDEWAVHVYADHRVLEQEVASGYESVRQAREELSQASPGRAYFLERKLVRDLAAATDEMLSRVAREAHGQLGQVATDAQVNSPARSASEQEGSIEVLHAAYLVPRRDTDAFVRTVDSVSDGRPGVRCERSGPWPPYSFVAPG